MATRLVLVLVMASWGCTDLDTPPVETMQRALVSADGDKEVFLLANAPLGADLTPALEHEKTPFWWVRIEVPRAVSPAVDTADGFFTDLETSSGVVFAQSYADSCDPYAEVPSVCWLLESYTGADEGLKGRLHVKRADGRLQLSYFVDWRGITDRFDGPPSWHNHISEGGGAAVIEEAE